jgi:hypothetical protein
MLAVIACVALAAHAESLVAGSGAGDFCWRLGCYFGWRRLRNLCGGDTSCGRFRQIRSCPSTISVCAMKFLQAKE